MLSLILDTSGYECFMEIMEKLEEGKSVSEKEWNKLFGTKGYKSLVSKEYNKEFFVKAFTLSFDPSLKDRLESELESSIGRYLRYYQTVKKRRKEYEENIAKIKENWKKLAGTIESRATSFLPDYEFEIEPVISIVIFDTDARGYDNIIVDASFTESMESFVSIVSHELFHHLRNQILCYNKEEVEEEERNIVQLIDQIHSEGIADHIDKEYFIYGNIKTPFPEEYIERYKKSMKESPDIIRKLDNKLQELLDEAKEKRNISKDLKRIVPLSGHPLGYYLTRLIIKNALVDKLIREVGNPFSFFELYNEAARRDKEVKPIFSEKSLKIFKDLEDKYSKNNP